MAAKEVKWSDFGMGADKICQLLATNPAPGLDLLAMGFNCGLEARCPTGQLRVCGTLDDPLCSTAL